MITTHSEAWAATILADIFEIKEELAPIKDALKDGSDRVAKSIEERLKQHQTDYADAVDKHTEKLGNSFNAVLAAAIAEAKKEIAASAGGLNQVKSSAMWVLLSIGLAASISVSAVYLTIWCKQVELELLQEEVATMKDNIAKLDNLKGHIVLANCEGQPCVEVADTAHVYGSKRNVFVLKGVKFKKH